MTGRAQQTAAPVTYTYTTAAGCDIKADVYGADNAVRMGSRKYYADSLVAHHIVEQVIINQGDAVCRYRGATERRPQCATGFREIELAKRACPLISRYAHGNAGHA